MAKWTEAPYTKFLPIFIDLHFLFSTTASNSMSDAEDESHDVSTALLDTRLSLPSATDSVSSRTGNKQHTKSQDQDSTDFLDIFSHESSGRSRLNGSSFRNMGACTRYSYLINRIRDNINESHYQKRISESDSYSAQVHPSHHAWQGCGWDGENRVRENSIFCSPDD
jgi:hypothetical protein